MKIPRYLIIVIMSIVVYAANGRIACDNDSDCFYVPKNTDGRDYLPALIVLNCMGATAEDAESLIDVADSLHMIVATCHGSRNHRDVFLNDQDIMKTYEKLVGNYNVDPLRVFISGFSGMGVQAMMSLFLHAAYFRGILAICAHKGAMRFGQGSALTDKYIYLISRENDWNLDDNRQMHFQFRDYGIRDTLVVTSGEHAAADQREILNACYWLIENATTK
jgi:predicted esterase